MTGDLSLFGDDQPEEPIKPAPTEAPLPDWLIASLRKALTDRGLTTMSDRQQAIEAVTERPVESLRTLTRAEAMRILSQLTPEPAKDAGSTSRWDDRSEDTWIDRL